jgi:hypothetical protein
VPHVTEWPSITLPIKESFGIIAEEFDDFCDEVDCAKGSGCQMRTFHSPDGTVLPAWPALADTPHIPAAIQRRERRRLAVPSRFYIRSSMLTYRMDGSTLFDFFSPQLLLLLLCPQNEELGR